ncbi:MAG: serine acetyltransferase [Chloroflexi bacterium]|nr:serine acetyltransferase [Chloroflexota bacterium]
MHAVEKIKICGEHCALDQPGMEEARNRLPGITKEILKTIGKEDSPDHVGFSKIPSQEALNEIVELVETLLYPGYYGEQEIDDSNLEFYIGNQVSKLFRVLSSQITKCLLHECSNPIEKCCDCEHGGKLKALEFMKKIPGLRLMLGEDVKAHYEGDPASTSPEEIIFCYPGLRAISIFRVAHELLLLGVPILPRMLTEFAHSATGVDIHPGATIGKSFFIDHATGVVIGETTVIGDRVKIYQGVTLGALSMPRDERGRLVRGTKRHPTIEDDVVIYANATILGGETVIGKGSVIGGNVWLTHSVPPGTKLIMDIPNQKFVQKSEKKK